MTNNINRGENLPSIHIRARYYEKYSKQSANKCAKLNAIKFENNIMDKMKFLTRASIIGAYRRGKITYAYLAKIF